MKINSAIALWCEHVVLVPYKRHHVPKYHSWMQSEELQELTASEPLTLEEEYDMQQRWLCDDDSELFLQIVVHMNNECTFIVLSRDRLRGISENALSEDVETTAMVGDVNLFFNDGDDPRAAEVEIMVAEASARGQGLGREAALAMMCYGVTELKVTRFVAKIGFDNERSQRMFARMGFEQTGTSAVFREVTLERSVSDEFRTKLAATAAELKLETREYSPLLV